MPKSKKNVGSSISSSRSWGEVSALATASLSTYALASLWCWNSADSTARRFNDAPIENACGWVGAWLADGLFYLLGFGAWAAVFGLLVPILYVAGRRLYTAVQWLLVITASFVSLGLLSLAFSAGPHEAYAPGGVLGDAISSGLVGVVGLVGAWIVLVYAWMSLTMLLAGASWSGVAEGLVGWVEAARPHLARGSGAFLGYVWGTVQGFFLAVWHMILAGLASMVEVLEALRPRVATLGGLIAAWAMRQANRGVAYAKGLGTRMVAALTADDAHIREDTSPGEVEMLRGSEPDVTAVAETPMGEQPEAAALHVMGGDSAVGDVLAMFPPLQRRRARPLLQPRTPIARAERVAMPLPEMAEDRSMASVMDGGTVPSAMVRAESVEARSVTYADVPSLHAREEHPVSQPAPSIVTSIPTPTPTPTSSPTPARQVDVEPAEGLHAQGDDDGGIVGESGNLYFELPALSLLDPVPTQRATIDAEELRHLATVVESALESFRIRGEVTNVRVGPVVTIFEYLPEPGIPVRKITGLADDLAMALKAMSVRVVAPIPGKGVVGIEIPSRHRLTMYLRELLASDTFRNGQDELPCILGKDVEGKPVIEDLAKMPHLLIGGTTGSGKSVGVNGMLMSLLYRRTPEELRLLLVDPKKLEFEAYSDVPHLLHPVVTDARSAAAALEWACREMDRRYDLLSAWKTRSIKSYNAKVERETRHWTSEKARKYAPKGWPDDVAPPKPELLPYIVIVIDELADLMMVAKKEVEVSIVRLAQMARACGMHMILATQRPSVDVITGLIKSNMPTRIAFKLRSVVDSRTIIDQGGAEKLLGRGDMLHLPAAGETRRCHGAFVSDDEVGRVTDFLRSQRDPDYLADITAPTREVEEVSPEDRDELYDEAVNLVISAGKASTSMVQRHLRIGYNRAARLIDAMESMGIVGPADGARPREVLVGSNPN